MTAQRFAPEPTELSAPFWEATRTRTYLLQWCDACSAPIYYPRYACPSCSGTGLSWRSASGRGVVHSYSVVHVPPAPWLAERLPYIVGLVDLEEGVRVLTNIVDCDPGTLRVDLPVEVTWEDLPDGRALPLFRPA